MSLVDEEATSARCRRFGMSSERLGVWNRANFVFANLGGAQLAKPNSRDNEVDDDEAITAL